MDLRVSAFISPRFLYFHLDDREYQFMYNLEEPHYFSECMSPMGVLGVGESYIDARKMVKILEQNDLGVEQLMTAIREYMGKKS